MAKRRPTPQSLKPNRIVEKLVPDPAGDPPQVTVLMGFIGRSARDGYWRLYLTKSLDQYVEIAEADIIHSEPASTAEDSAGATLVWVAKRAKLEYRRVEAREIEAEFLTGPVTEQYFHQASGAAFAVDHDSPLQEGGSMARTCHYHMHLLTKIDGSCNTQRCTERPECPPPPQPPQPPEPPWPPQPPPGPRSIAAHITCTRRGPGNIHFTTTWGC